MAFQYLVSWQIRKADCHTDDSNIITVANGCMTEFVVDFDNLNSDAKRMGIYPTVPKIGNQEL